MKYRLVTLLVVLFANCASALDLSAFSQHALVKFGVINNFLSDGKFSAFVEIDNQSAVPLPPGKSDWQLYIHSSRRIVTQTSAHLMLQRVQGDLYSISPTADFKGIKRGETFRFDYVGVGEIASYSYFMPRAFMADSAGKSYVIANTDSEDFSDFVYPLDTPEKYLRFNIPKDDYGLTSQDPGFAEKYHVEPVSVPISIIPSPVELQVKSGEATVDTSWSVQQYGGLLFAENYLRAHFASRGVTLANHDNTTKRIQLVIDESIDSPEGYQLDIEAKQIVIKAKASAGIFYGVQSLLSLTPANSLNQEFTLPLASVADSPRYAWRGMHYDIARNFHGKAAIMALVEQMGRYKLNKLHLHLSDDEGWRLQIPGLDELTDIGASRCFDLSEQRCLLTQLGNGPNTDEAGSGYLSTSDYIELVQFAAQRNVAVIPEIDMPGHARAAIVAMKARHHKLLAQGKKTQAGQYLLSDPDDKSQYLTVQSYSDNSINACMPSTYQFIQKVVYEVQKMHRMAGAKLEVLHIGGDEVGKGSWQDSPACQTLFAKGEANMVGVDDVKPYFVKKVAEIAAQRGIAIAGWEDGLMYDRNTPFDRANLANNRVIANAWDNIWESGVSDRAYLLANAGYQVIISAATHLYFDHPHEASPSERGYHWATRYSDLSKVFGFMPDNIYANAKKTFSGKDIDNLNKLVNKSHISLQQPDNIIGMQGQLWSETIRSPEQLEQMIYPRIIALAERAWHKAEWEVSEQNVDSESYQRDWAQFLTVLVEKELPKLAKEGINFYLPPPRLKRDSNSVLVNSLINGLVTEYSIDQGQTWLTSGNMTFSPQGDVLFRSRLGNISSRNISISSTTDSNIRFGITSDR